MNKGFYFSLEALISMLLVSLLIIASNGLNQAKEGNLMDLTLMQKAHDLLKVWGKERNLSSETIKKDFEFVFPNGSGLIEAGQEKIFIGEKKKNFFTVDSQRINEEREIDGIKITIYY